MLQGFRIGYIGAMGLYILVGISFLLSISLIVAREAFHFNIPFMTIIISATVFVVLAAAAFRKELKKILPPWTHMLINVFSATAFDLFAKGACLIIYPFKQTYFDPKLKDVVDQTPILLIHGYLDNSSVWAYHRYHYQNAGFKNIFTVDLGHPFHSIEEYAEVVRKRIHAIVTLTGKREIHLIGYSMGGVVGTYYAVHLAKPDGITVKDLITMGSPLQGTPLSVIGIGQCARQMRKNNPFILKLTRDLSQSGIPCFCQGSRADLVVFPGTSSMPVSHGFYKFRVYDNIGHISFLFSDPVIENNIAYLHYVYRS